MGPLRLALACGEYDRMRAIWSGRISPEGISLTYLSLPPGEIFWRMLKYEEFDVSEMSLSAYILGLSRGDQRFVAIPVFPSRIFRHSFIFVNSHAGIREPEQLKGRRIGVPEYHMTAALFIRGLLSDEYGVHPTDLQWYQGGLERPGRIERLELTLPPSLRLQQVGDRTIDEMLIAGDLDAIATASIPPSFRKGSPEVRRLFPNAKDVERESYKRTGIFPIMHVIVIKREIFDQHPWVAQSLMKAFQEAKAEFYARLSGTVAATATILPFSNHNVEETTSLFGADFWPYGVEANKATLEAALRYSHEQGLSARKVSLEELFASNSVDAFLD